MKQYTATHRFRGLQLHALRRLRPQGRLRYRLDGGEPFVLHVGDRLSELIFTGRRYEAVESVFCRNFLRAGDVAWDVGANIGYFATLFARSVGDRGLVVALEPGLKTYGLLRETVRLLGLGNVVCLPLALWHRAEVLAFHHATGGEDAQQSFARRDKQGSLVQTQPVAALPFTALADSEWFRTQQAPALIKIDVEGAEPQVLAGLDAYLDARGDDVPVLMVEVNVEALRAMDNDPAALLTSLAKRHELYFTPLHWPPWHAECTSFSRLGEPSSEQAGLEINVLAVPRGGRWRERALKALG